MRKNIIKQYAEHIKMNYIFNEFDVIKQPVRSVFRLFYPLHVAYIYSYLNSYQIYLRFDKSLNNCP